ncbi:MAG: hypothetical protein ABTQ25_15985 [Nitrosomonas ureae]
MPLNEQIGIYASVILALLALLRIISGITGSRRVKEAVLQSTVTTTYFLIFAALAKFSIEFEFLKDVLVTNKVTIQWITDCLIILWLAFMAYQFGLGVIYRLYTRSIRFKDWGTFKNLKITLIVRLLKWAKRSFEGDRKEYETDPLLTANCEKTINIINKHISKNISSRRPVLITGTDPWELRKNIIFFIAELLEKTDEEFNYVCCTVSPDSIWRLFDEVLGVDSANKIKERLVFVDAYTEAFGFGDEIVEERLRKMNFNGRVQIVKCNSAAGVHTATSTAFKLLKTIATQNRRSRGACTMIYDTLSVLAIPETENEISEFIIHLSAAEHTYDMLTIFLEPDLPVRSSKSLDSMRACCGSPIPLEQTHMTRYKYLLYQKLKMKFLS